MKLLSVILTIAFLSLNSFAALESKNGKESIEVLASKDGQHFSFKYCETAKNGQKECRNLGNHESYSLHEVNEIVKHVSSNYHTSVMGTKNTIQALFSGLAFGSGLSLLLGNGQNIDTTNAIVSGSFALYLIVDRFYTDAANNKLEAIAVLTSNEKNTVSSGVVKFIAKKLDAELQ